MFLNLKYLENLYGMKYERLTKLLNSFIVGEGVNNKDGFVLLIHSHTFTPISILPEGTLTCRLEKPVIEPLIF